MDGLPLFVRNKAYRSLVAPMKVILLFPEMGEGGNPWASTIGMIRNHVSKQ